MTITQLYYVLAVAEHQNFTKAAEKCFVTQPTLSMQIQKLEDQLDTQPELYADYVEIIVQELSTQTHHEYGQESQSNAHVEGMLAYRNEIYRSFHADFVKENGQWFLSIISIDPVVYDSVYGNIDFPEWFLPIWELFSPLWESLFEEWLNP